MGRSMSGQDIAVHSKGQHARRRRVSKVQGPGTYLRVKRFPQTEHPNRLRSSWHRWCLFKCSERLKLLEQREHWNLRLSFMASEGRLS